MAEGDTYAISALVRKRAELAELVELRRAELTNLLWIYLTLPTPCPLRGHVGLFTED